MWVSKGINFGWHIVDPFELQAEKGRRRSFSMNSSDLCLYLLLISFFRQAKIQYQALENLHGLLQLFTNCGDYWREDLYYAWWTKSWSAEYGTDQKSYETYWCAWHWWVRWSGSSRREKVQKPWCSFLPSNTQTPSFSLRFFVHYSFHRSPMWSPLVRSRQRHFRMVRKRSWSFFHLRSRCSLKIPSETRHGFNL